MQIRHVLLPVVFVVSFFTVLTVGFAYTQLYQHTQSSRPSPQVAAVVENQPTRTQVLGKSQGRMWFSTFENNAVGQTAFAFQSPNNSDLYLSYQEVDSLVTVSFYPLTPAELVSAVEQDGESALVTHLPSFTNRSAENVQVISPWGERAALTMPDESEGLWLVVAEGDGVRTHGVVIIST